VRRLLSVALALSLALSACGSAEQSHATATAAATRPPVVMLVLDEFTSAALLDHTMRIDPGLYPHLAAVASNSDVFSNFTAPADETNTVMASLLTGGAYDPRAQPSWKQHRRNLFTSFAKSYGMVVREEATNMCPPRTCPGDRAPLGAKDVLSYVGGGGRIARYRDWLGQIRPRSRPTFFFQHLLLPHGPAQYNPSGTRYNPYVHEEIPGLNQTPSFGDPWFVRQAWQRYQMQVLLVDRLVGELVARLKAQGLYDRSLIVVTADNGEGFGHAGSDPHRIDNRTAVEVAATPLIVKRPGQRTGAYVRRHVRTADVVPTLGRLAGVSVGPTAGRPFYGPGAGRIPSGVAVRDDRGRVRRWSLGTYERLLRLAVRRRIAVFGEGAGGLTRLYRAGPQSGLVGRSAASLNALAAKGTSWKLSDPKRFRRVSPGGPFVPTHVIGTVKGLKAGTPVAVAIDGVIAGTGRVAASKASRARWVSVLVPESALRAGDNAVSLYVLGGPGPRRVALR
jgi:hypothetical protein